MRSIPSKPRPVTPQRIERALDRVAEMIVASGEKGTDLLPLYDYLEKSLQDCNAKGDRLAAVHQRFERSRGRTASQPS